MTYLAGLTAALLALVVVVVIFVAVVLPAYASALNALRMVP